MLLLPSCRADCLRRVVTVEARKRLYIGVVKAQQVVRLPVAARPGRRDRPREAAAAGLVVRLSIAARPGRPPGRPGRKD